MTNSRSAILIASAMTLLVASWGQSASDPLAAGQQREDGKNPGPRHQARKRIRDERRGSARRLSKLEKEIQALRAEIRTLTTELQAARAAGQVPIVAEAKPLEPATPEIPPDQPKKIPEFPIVFPIAHYDNRDGGDLILMVSPEGGKAVLSNANTGDTKPLKLSGDEDHPHKISPVSENAHSIVALGIKGPKITRLAVLSFGQPSTPKGPAYAWYSIDLREPVDLAVPVVRDYVSAIYYLGRHVYAFSRPAARWDVLELPKGVEIETGYSHDGPNIKANGHIYTFVIETGKWKDYDARAVFDSQFKP